MGIDTVLDFIMPETKGRTTLAIIKPDAVTRGYAPKIINMIKGAGFNVLATRQAFKLSRADAEFLYAEHKDKDFFEDLIKFTLSGPVILLVITAAGDNVPADFRALLGATEPAEAEPGTIRYEFGLTGDEFTGQQNAVHGSADEQRAVEELTYFLKLYCYLF